MPGCSDDLTHTASAHRANFDWCNVAALFIQPRMAGSSDNKRVLTNTWPGVGHRSSVKATAGGRYVRSAGQSHLVVDERSGGRSGQRRLDFKLNEIKCGVGR
jgi:hypothetical protein